MRSPRRTLHRPRRGHVPELVAWLNARDDTPLARAATAHRHLVSIHPLVRAATAHWHLVSIHPRADGNGRMSRSLQTTTPQTAEPAARPPRRWALASRAFRPGA